MQKKEKLGKMAKNSRPQLNRIAQDLRRTIQEIKQQSNEAYPQELTDDASTDFTLWKATKRIKRSVVQVPPVRKHDRIRSRVQTFPA